MIIHRVTFVDNNGNPITGNSDLLRPLFLNKEDAIQLQPMNKVIHNQVRIYTSYKEYIQSAKDDMIKEIKRKLTPQECMFLGI
jgi:hypothetical protein